MTASVPTILVGGPLRDAAEPSSRRMTPEQRRMRASLAANEMWARTPDRSTRTAPARKAALDRFERQVDPDGVLPIQERAKRAENARKAFYLRLALRSSRARAKRKQKGGTT
jgi:hypothetical protein